MSAGVSTPAWEDRSTWLALLAEPNLELVEQRPELDRMSARLRDPEWSDCGAPRIAAWGWKPA